MQNNDTDLFVFLAIYVSHLELNSLYIQQTTMTLIHSMKYNYIPSVKCNKPTIILSPFLVIITMFCTQRNHPQIHCRSIYLTLTSEMLHKDSLMKMLLPLPIRECDFVRHASLSQVLTSNDSCDSKLLSSSLQYIVYSKTV